MKNIFIISAVICILIVIIVFILFEIILPNHPSGDYPTISFNQFIALYRINPEKWMLEADYVQYKLVNQNGFWYTNYKIIEFATIVDNFKYKRWVKKETKRKEEVKRSKEMTELIAEWQEDINNAQKANVQRTKELMRKNEEDAKKYGGLNNEA